MNQSSRDPADNAVTNVYRSFARSLARSLLLLLLLLSLWDTDNGVISGAS